MKKFSVAILVFMIVFVNIYLPISAHTENNLSAQWQATADNGGQGDNIVGYFIGTSEKTISYSQRLAKKLTSGDAYWYKTSGALAENETPISLTIDYYDAEEGSFYIEYQTYSFDPKVIKTSKTDSIVCNGAKEWKQIKIELDKPLFNGGLTFRKNYKDYNTDFKIVNDSQSGSVYIGSVTAAKSGDYPIAFEFNHNTASNVYTQETLKLPITYKNTKGTEITQNIKIKIYDDNNGVVWSKNENITLQSGDKKNIEYTPYITKFGKYKFEISLTDGGFSRSEQIPFSVVNGAKGIKNERMNINQEFGLSNNDDEYQDRVDLVKLGGFGALRGGIYWSSVEREKGVLKLDRDDRYYNGYSLPSDLVKNDFVTIISLGLGNRLYTENWDPYRIAVFPQGEEAVNAFVNYCKFMAETFAEQAPGRAKYYALWNEFNGGFNMGTPRATNKEYAEMLKKVYPVIKAADPNAEVVAMVTSDGLQSADETPYYDFIKEVLDYGTYDYFDAISVHTYMWRGADHIKKVTELRKLLEDHRGENKPKKEIYYTECGYPTSRISERGQAAYLVKMYSEALANNLGSKFWWYDLMNKDSSQNADEQSFGMLLNPSEGGYAKDSYIAVCGLNNFMYDADFKEKLSIESDVSAYSFEKPNGENVAVLWYNNPRNSANDLTSGREVTLDLKTDGVDVYDVFTNKIKHLDSDDGTFDFDLTGSPIYVCGRFGSLSEQQKVHFYANGKDFYTENESVSFDYTVANYGERISGNIRATLIDNEEEKVLSDMPVSVAARTNITKTLSVSDLKGGRYSVKFEFETMSGEQFSRELSFYVVPDYASDECSVEYKDNKLKASIKTNAYAYTALVLKDSEGRIVCINQGQADEGGNCYIESPFKLKGIYTASVYTGKALAQKVLNTLNESESVGYEIERNGEIIYDKSKLKDGDDIVLKVYYDGTDKADVYTALYNQNGMLNMVKKEGLNDNTAKFELHIDKVNDIKSWKIFVWNSDLMPLSHEVVIIP